MYILSQDGKTLGNYQLLAVKKVHGGKNIPDYAIFGYCPTGNADRALFSEPIIGYYESEEQAGRVLADISAAMENGAEVYRLK